MRAGAKNLVKCLLDDYPLTSPPQRLLDVVTSTILANGWDDHPTLAAERAEKWSAKVKAQLRLRLNELQEIGRPARIEFNTSDLAYVQGACFIAPRDPPQVQEQKLRRSRVDQYHGLLRQLDPHDFELLCRRVLKLFGVRLPCLTRGTADEGIDFFGQLEGETIFFPQDLQPTIQRQLSIWLVGQAKRYTNAPTGTPVIRDLVGAVTLAKAGGLSTATSPFPGLTIRVSDPVFLMLMTAGTLSTRAWNLAARSGVIAIDGEILAAFLVDRVRGLGDSPQAMDFRNWLRRGTTPK